ncbi:MAG: DUF1080 domain-containing protein [Planctomycetota bacterium]
MDKATANFEHTVGGIGSAKSSSAKSSSAKSSSAKSKLRERRVLGSIAGRLFAYAFLLLVFPAAAIDVTAEDSSTLGLAPPKGAIVLFDGSGFDAWKPFSWQWINPSNDQDEIQWKLVGGDAMEIASELNGKRRKQFLCTKQSFGDYRLHLEFQCPKGESGNSGVFFGPLYELQILNSAQKATPGLGDCGAIYQIRVPDLNAALDAGVWQALDLEYQAATVGDNGFMTEKGAARVTVRLNGKLIHDDFKLSLRRNKYAAFPETPTTPIVLQDHGSKVQFRNIWIVEKSTDVK